MEIKFKSLKNYFDSIVLEIRHFPIYRLSWQWLIGAETWVNRIVWKEKVSMGKKATISSLNGMKVFLIIKNFQMHKSLQSQVSNIFFLYHKVYLIYNISYILFLKLWNKPAYGLRHYLSKYLFLFVKWSMLESWEKIKLKLVFVITLSKFKVLSSVQI